MANIDAGGQSGKRKAIDHEIPLVPFIDLLLCCIMFLLATAVWEEMARITAQQQGDPEPVPLPAVSLILSITDEGYVLADTTGVRREIAKRDGEFDVIALQGALRERRVLEPDRSDLVVAPGDEVPYDAVVGAMDMARGEGYPHLVLSSPR